MIRAWLDFSTFGIFLSLGILYFGTALLLGVLIFRSPLKKPILSLTGIVAPFFSSSAILFALLVGFLANDISDRSRQASRAIQAEASELHNVYALSVAAVADMAAIREALKGYVDSAITNEWPAMAEGRESLRTSAAYDELLRRVSDPSIAKSSGTAVGAALLNAAVRAGNSRNDRIALASDHTNDLKWLVVILLALITEISISLVHLEKPRACMTTLLVFSTSVVITLGFMALQEYPFYGAFRLSPAPLDAVRVLSGLTGL